MTNDINNDINNGNDFFTRYLQITSGTEVPAFFNRWAMLSSVAAWLGRSVYFKHGSFKIYPNLYVILLGVPGTRKSTAIKLASRVIRHAGYNTFSAEKTTKERFLLDLSGADATETADGFLDLDLNKTDSECFIANDEFNDFFGNNILEFVSLLGVLWDYEGTYESKVKNSASVYIQNPTINILGGNTQTTFANTFPPEVMGQGFFSRMIAVYAEDTQRRITFPREPTKEEMQYLIDHLFAMRENCVGQMGISPEAMEYLDDIYQNWEPLEDTRFAHYCNRRLTHLIKLIMLHCAMRLDMTIQPEDVTYANTILSHTEHYMPKAFGEYGKAKNSGSTHKILHIIEEASEAVTFEELWSKVCSDITDLNQLSDIMKNLTAAKKIQVTEHGFLPNKKPLNIIYDKLINYKYLTKAELNGG